MHHWKYSCLSSQTHELNQQSKRQFYSRHHKCQTFQILKSDFFINLPLKQKIIADKILFRKIDNLPSTIVRKSQKRYYSSSRPNDIIIRFKIQVMFKLVNRYQQLNQFISLDFRTSLILTNRCYFAQKEVVFKIHNIHKKLIRRQPIINRLGFNHRGKYYQFPQQQTVQQSRDKDAVLRMINQISNPKQKSSLKLISDLTFMMNENWLQIHPSIVDILNSEEYVKKCLYILKLDMQISLQIKFLVALCKVMNEKNRKQCTIFLLKKYLKNSKMSGFDKKYQMKTYETIQIVQQLFKTYTPEILFQNEEIRKMYETLLVQVDFKQSDLDESFQYIFKPYINFINNPSNNLIKSEGLNLLSRIHQKYLIKNIYLIYQFYRQGFNIDKNIIKIIDKGDLPQKAFENQEWFYKLAVMIGHIYHKQSSGHGLAKIQVQFNYLKEFLYNSTFKYNFDLLVSYIKDKKQGKQKFYSIFYYYDIDLSKKSIVSQIQFMTELSKKQSRIFLQSKEQQSTQKPNEKQKVFRKIKQSPFDAQFILKSQLLIMLLDKTMKQIPKGEQLVGMRQYLMLVMLHLLRSKQITKQNAIYYQNNLIEVFDFCGQIKGLRKGMDKIIKQINPDKFKQFSKLYSIVGFIKNKHLLAGFTGKNGKNNLKISHQIIQAYQKEINMNQETKTVRKRRSKHQIKLAKKQLQNQKEINNNNNQTEVVKEITIKKSKQKKISKKQKKKGKEKENQIEQSQTLIIKQKQSINLQQQEGQIQNQKQQTIFQQKQLNENILNSTPIEEEKNSRNISEYQQVSNSQQPRVNYPQSINELKFNYFLKRLQTLKNQLKQNTFKENEVTKLALIINCSQQLGSTYLGKLKQALMNFFITQVSLLPFSCHIAQLNLIQKTQAYEISHIEQYLKQLAKTLNHSFLQTDSHAFINLFISIFSSKLNFIMFLDQNFDEFVSKMIDILCGKMNRNQINQNQKYFLALLLGIQKQNGLRNNNKIDENNQIVLTGVWSKVCIQYLKYLQVPNIIYSSITESVEQKNITSIIENLIMALRRQLKLVKKQMNHLNMQAYLIQHKYIVFADASSSKQIIIKHLLALCYKISHDQIIIIHIDVNDDCFTLYQQLKKKHKLFCEFLDQSKNKNQLILRSLSKQKTMQNKEIVQVNKSIVQENNQKLIINDVISH